MKKYFGLQKVILALTTLTLVGLSSCNDQNFDWDEAHATQQYEKFTNVFIKEFGKPAEGHQWGFDMADMALGGDINLESSTRAVVKQDYNVPGVNKQVGEYLGKPADITEHEHLEVYNWFSNHKVNWSITPTHSSNGNYTRGLTDGKVYEINDNFNYGSLENNSANYGVLHTYNYNENGLDMHFWNAWIQHVNSNKTSTKQTYAYAENDPAYKFVGSDHKCNGGVPHKNSNEYYYKKLDGKFVRCTKNGYVFYKHTDKNEYYVKNGDAYYKVSDDNGNYDGNTIYNFQVSEMEPYSCICEQSNNFKLYQDNFTTAGHMDYMCCWGYDLDGSSEGKWQDHLNDFNSGQGYGYGKQETQNAILVTNANVKNWTCGISVGGSMPHDKYILVYLEGDDYKGWYLGFDFESWGPNLTNRVAADGICNDWIIKIGNFGDSTPYNPARIMCEDLGGDRTTNNYPQASDIDYNDIVLDVRLEDDQSVTLTLQAAGGTLPLLVTYGDIPLFETHEFFQESYTWDEGKNNRGQINYSVMYNTGADNEGIRPAVEFKLFFNGQTTPSGTKCKQVNADKFVFGDLHLKVYRQGIDDYMKSNTTSLSVAEWVDLGNVSGQAPLKLCVPSTTKWLKERREINLGYPKFMDWVADPLQKFWEKETNNDYLYTK